MDKPNNQPMSKAELDEIRTLLTGIVEFFEMSRGDMKQAEFFGMIAAKLSALVGREPAWTARYPQSVLSGTISPSPEFARAVKGLGALLDDMPAILASAVRITIFAQPGTIREGSLVLGQSKVCARAGCRVMFVPNVPWRKFCSTECYLLETRK